MAAAAVSGHPEMTFRFVGDSPLAQTSVVLTRFVSGSRSWLFGCQA
jgi:hypothetical protein